MWRCLISSIKVFILYVSEDPAEAKALLAQYHILMVRRTNSAFSDELSSYSNDWNLSRILTLCEPWWILQRSPHHQERTFIGEAEYYNSSQRVGSAIVSNIAAWLALTSSTCASLHRYPGRCHCTISQDHWYAAFTPSNELTENDSDVKWFFIRSNLSF